ncbi:MAG TPA: putative phage tail protein [Chloroflexota bacterium]|nr:putative phage tail protein [Chloroflexota bacterium]
MPLPLLTSPAGQRLLGYSWDGYSQSRVYQSIIEAIGSEVDLARSALTSVLNEFYVDTASETGLARMDAELGLPPPPPGQPLVERRERITSHKRGTGTATNRVIKLVAEAYDKGAVEVIEDYTPSMIVIQFVDTRGVPPNLDDLKAAVRAVVQAHLALEYAFRYLIVSELTATGMTVAQLTALNLTVEQLKTWSPP